MFTNAQTFKPSQYVTPPETSGEGGWYAASMILEFPYFTSGKAEPPLMAVTEVFFGCVFAPSLERAVGMTLDASADRIAKLKLTVEPVLRMTRGYYNTVPSDRKPDMLVRLS